MPNPRLSLYEMESNSAEKRTSMQSSQLAERCYRLGQGDRVEYPRWRCLQDFSTGKESRKDAPARCCANNSCSRKRIEQRIIRKRRRLVQREQQTVLHESEIRNESGLKLSHTACPLDSGRCDWTSCLTSGKVLHKCEEC